METSVWSNVQRSMVGRNVRQPHEEVMTQSPRVDPALQIGGSGFAAALRLVSEEHDLHVAHLNAEIVRLHGILRTEYGAVVDDMRRVPTSSRVFGTHSPRGLRLEMPTPRGGFRQESANPQNQKQNASQTVATPSIGMPAPLAGVSPGAAGPRAVPRPPPQTPCGPTDPQDDGDGCTWVEGDLGEESPRARSSFCEEATSEESDDKGLRSEADGPRGVTTLASVQDIVVGMKRETSMRSWTTEAVQRDRSRVRVECFFGTAIILNTLLLGVSIDVHPEWLGWVIIDGAFACIFLAEIFVKSRVQGLLQFVVGAGRIPNCFEILLVAAAFVEFALSIISFSHEHIGNERFVSFVRLLRYFRVFRVMRVWRLEIFCELTAMIRGTVGGMRTLAWAIVLICLPVYAMSIFLRETVDSREHHRRLAEGHSDVAHYFSSVPLAFYSVFRCSVLEECLDADGRPMFLLLEEERGWIFGAVWSVMGVFMSFGLFNVIEAMFVENVVQAAMAKKVQIRRDRLRDTAFFAHRISELLIVILDHTQHQNVDDNLTGLRSTPRISEMRNSRRLEDVFEVAADLKLDKDTFEAVWRDSRAMRILDDLDIAEQDRGHMFDVLDCDGSGSIDIDELCNGIMKLRGDTCRSDIVGVSFLVQDTRSEMRAYMSSIMRHMTEQQEAIEKYLDVSPNRAANAGRTSSKESGYKRKATKDAFSSRE